MRIAFLAAAVALSPVAAERAAAFEVVQERAKFVELLTGRKLTRLGISLNVSADGVIQGRAFGKPVTGQWRWENGYFCRTLYHGRRDLGANCQQVKVSGATLRFTTDRGTGIYADLRLK